MSASALPMPVASALELIGNTPMLELTHGFDTGPCRLFVKLENSNPGGSIKDRIALTMIEAAEKDGRLKPGGTIVEATAGNTGLGLAQVGILKGYRLVLVVPDKMAREKIQHLRGLGRRCAAHPLGRRQGPPGILSGHRRAAHPRNPRRLLHQPVLQPRQSPGARDHHGAGNLRADGARTWMRWWWAWAPAAR